MRRLMCLLLLQLVFVSVSAAEREAPKLVVVLIVDGLSQDFVTETPDLLTRGGIRKFLEEGSWYADARYSHSTTFTAVGHATILTGAPPYKSGIVGNDWFNREGKVEVYCVEDPDSRLLDETTSAHTGTSPRNLKVTTVGDELRLSNGMKSKVISVSIKDRGAILPGGKTGTAYFYSSSSGRFITSSYYMEDYPKWWHMFLGGRPQDEWIGQNWEPLLEAAAYEATSGTNQPTSVDYKGLGRVFPYRLKGHAESDRSAYYSRLTRTPFGVDLTLKFAKAAIQGENLGKNPAQVPDMLCISLSPQDYVNHNFGPESMEALDAYLRLDRSLAEFFGYLDDWLGLEDVALVLTADHGFGNVPEYLEKLGVEAGRIDLDHLISSLNEALEQEFGAEGLVEGFFSPTFYLDWARIDSLGLSREKVEDVAAGFLRKYPGISHVYTRSQLEEGEMLLTELTGLVARSWNAEISGDLFVIQQSGWYLLKNTPDLAATHGSPWTYDTTVPLMFLGQWFKPGKKGNAARVEDLSATLAYLLQVRSPSGCEGRVLLESLVE